VWRPVVGFELRRWRRGAASPIATRILHSIGKVGSEMIYYDEHASYEQSERVALACVLWTCRETRERR
jgi:hypothetical protein